MQLEKEFRSFLQNELLKRCNQNKQYSLRAFARFLKVEPSSLSKILHGKRAISEKMLLHFAERFNLTPGEIERFRSSSSKTGREFKDIELDVYEVMSHWYHYAILELTYTRGFKNEVRWIAKTLGITVSEANIAIERLIRLGYLKKDEAGNFIDCFERLTTLGLGGEALTARKKFQKQLLEKAMESLDEFNEGERDQSSMTFAMNPKFLPEAKDHIKSFRRKLSKQVQSQHPKGEVYQLVISLFPLTKVEANA